MVNLKIGNTVEVPGLKVTGGSPAAGRVLTSDAAGTATWAGVPYDLSMIIYGANTVRANGPGDNPFGVKLQRAVIFTSFTVRCNTADASGSGVYTFKANNVNITGMTATVAAASQVAGATVTGSWSLNAGDVLTCGVSSNGTTPGTGLIVDLKGTAP